VSFSISEPTIVASPALSHISVASWSALDNVYQQNVADAAAAVLKVLQSNHNTWNFPSPPVDAFRSPSPVAFVPRSPTPELTWPVLDNQEDYPFLDIPDSPAYIVTSAPVSPTPVFSLDVLAHVAAHEPAYREDEKENLLPAPTQDSYVHQHLGHDLEEHIVFEDIPAAPLPPPVVEAPIATVPSPAPESRQPTPGVTLLSEVPLADLFPNLFHAPACTYTVDRHPHQYQVVYDRGEKFWVPAEEFVQRDFLRLLPRIPDLETHPVSFVTPFRADVFHNVWVKSNGPLPSINLCAKVGRHPHSASFPFGYLESSFIDSIKFIFGQFPPDWLEYFEGTLVPLIAYDFLDGRIATLCGRLHFTADGIFVIDRNTRTEDLLRTQPGLAAFVCTPRLPTNPFAYITPPPVEVPL